MTCDAISDADLAALAMLRAGASIEEAALGAGVSVWRATALWRRVQELITESEES